jgi:hypothetical protein
MRRILFPLRDHPRVLGHARAHVVFMLEVHVFPLGRTLSKHAG